MKIALVSQEYPPETAHGGIATQTYSKAKGLAGLGHEVYVISRSISTTRQEISDGNITTIRIPGMDEQLPEMTEIVQWITHSVVVAVELENLHKRIGFDIIDFPEWAAESYTWLLNRTEWKTIPTVIQLHGPLVMLAQTVGWPDTDKSFYKIGFQMEATCIQLADAVYSSSECSANWIRKHYHNGQNKIPIIHSGIDTMKFSPQQVEKNEKPTIIFIGKIVPNKGVEELVDAACNLAKYFPDLRLKMFGRCSQELIRKLKQKADRSGASDLLDFPGFISKEAIPLELSKSHVFSAPSYYEGGPGFVYLEAMACGLPVIGCSGSGVDEIITSGVNGILIPPRDRNSLENALRLLLSSREISTEMGRNARKYAVNEADTKICLKKLESFYLSVLHSKKGQAIAQQHD